MSAASRRVVGLSVVVIDRVAKPVTPGCKSLMLDHFVLDGGAALFASPFLALMLGAPNYALSYGR